jgi:integrase
MPGWKHIPIRVVTVTSRATTRSARREAGEATTVIRERPPEHFAYVATRASTGMRACHVSALQWADIDEAAGVIRVARKQVEGVVGEVIRKKQVPKEFPLHPELATILREQRQRLPETKAPGPDSGWVFPAVRTGKLRGANSMRKAWVSCLKAVGITERFTRHGCAARSTTC